MTISNHSHLFCDLPKVFNTTLISFLHLFISYYFDENTPSLSPKKSYFSSIFLRLQQGQVRVDLTEYHNGHFIKAVTIKHFCYLESNNV